MKIIIDANVASEFSDKTPEAKAIVGWLRSKGFLSTGGLNLTELNRTRIREFVIELLRSGRGAVCPSADIDVALTHLEKFTVESNDQHILALAVAAGARIVYTKDEALIKDFCNRDLINRPRGHCYKDAAKHKHLLS